MTRKVPIATEGAPPSTGTHTQALRVGKLVFLTGQTGREPSTGILAYGLENQTRRTLANIEAVLDAAGCTAADIVDVKFIMTDLKYFKPADKIYSAWLPPREEVPLPACTAFVVTALPAGALIIIEATALLPEA